MVYFIIFLCLLIIYSIYDIIQYKEDKKYFIFLGIVTMLTLLIGIVNYNDNCKRGLSNYILNIIEDKN